MALDEEHFVGDRLRLSSFLRVVNRLPLHRPSRCRRRESNSSELHPAKRTYSSDSDQTLTNPSSTNSKSDVTTFNPPASGKAARTAASLTHSQQHSPRRNCLFAHSPAPGEVHSAVSDEQEPVLSPGGTLQENDIPGPMRFRHRKKITETCKAKIGATPSSRSPRTRGESSTRKRHQLPFTELALARTSTETELPERAEKTTAPGPAEVGPIEESQLMPYNHQLGEHGVARPSRTPRQSPSRPSRPSAEPMWAITSRAKVAAPHIKKVTTPVRLTAGNMASDGFVGAELCIPLRLKKPTTRRRPKYIVARRNYKLDLVTGALPTAEADSESTSNPGGFPAPAMSVAPVTNFANINHPGYSDDILRHGQLHEGVFHGLRQPTDPLVIAQLAGIVAPVRREDSSESEGSEGVKGISDEIEDEETQDIWDRIAESEKEAIQHFHRGDASYFESAIHRLGSMHGVSNESWSQSGASE